MGQPSASCILAGTFSFAGEFPDFRDLDAVLGVDSRRSCDQLFDIFLAHCDSRRAKEDLALITVASVPKKVALRH